MGNFLFLWMPKKLNKKPSIFYCALRMLVYSLIVIALAGIQFTTEVKDTHTIILVDQSASMTLCDEEVKAYINEQLTGKQVTDYVEIIGFGENSAVEQLMTSAAMAYKAQLIVDKSGTNFEEAVKFALNRFDQDKNKRLMLISDFKETSGDLLSSIIKKMPEGIEFKHYLLDDRLGVDVQLSQMKMPENIKIGERFPVTVSVTSSHQTPALLTIYSDEKITLQKNVQLKSGTQRFVFEDQLETTGNHQYVARIESSKDSVVENNQWHQLIEVEGPAKILLIDPNGEGELYSNHLSNQGIQVSYRQDNLQGTTLETLAFYDGVLIVNASIESLDTEFIKNLELYVKELGGGLLTIGGDVSYAVGGYENTLLEKMLPINMALKVEGERYDLAMMAVVDKSGSMSGSDSGPSKMKMAKEAVVRVAETLSDRDQLGLIAFDGSFHEILSLTEVTSLDEVIKKVAGVKADGGTSILPALKKGLENLGQTTLKGKHLLLVSDGQGEQGGYEQLIQQYPDVTISTIAIGDDADAHTMKKIAELGNGRFYLVTDYRKIPEIFTKETRLAMDAFIKEGIFVPEKNSLHPIVANVAQLPLVYGYVGTTLKGQSELILSIEEEPLLATWQYGLGRTMAWTSDVSDWTRLYYEQAQGIQLLTDLPASIFSTHEFETLQLDVQVSNNSLEINGLNKENKALEVSVLSVNGQEKQIEVAEYGDGYFEGKARLSDEGFVFLRVLDTVNKQLVHQQAIAVNYSKEYDLSSGRIIESDYRGLIDSELLSDKGLIFTEIEEPAKALQSYDDILLMLAMILFVLDVACRKLRFDPIAGIMEKKQELNKDGKGKIISNTVIKPSEIEDEEQRPVIEEKEEKVIDTGRLLSKMRKRE